MKNWKNLKKDKCPNCGKTLQFRVGGDSYKIKANKGFAKQKGLYENMYFCSVCDGFQISERKLLDLKRKLELEDRKEFADNPIFRDGFLSL